MQTFIVIDEKFANECGLENFHSVFPQGASFNDGYIPFEKQSLITKEILNLRERLADLFVDSYYLKFLDYKAESCKVLFLNCGGLYTFLLADRLIRLNFLARKVNLSTVVLPKIDYTFSKNWSYERIFYNEIEQNPFFNQWIVNRLLLNVQQISISNKMENVSFQKVDHHLDVVESLHSAGKIKNFYLRIKKKFFSTDIISLLWTTQNYIKQNALKYIQNLHLSISTKGSVVAWDGLGPVSAEIKKKGRFIWPIGLLCLVKEISIISSVEDKVNVELDKAVKNDVALLFKEFFKKIGEEIYLPDSTFLSIADILKDILPAITTEDAKVSTKKYIDRFTSFKNKSYFCAGTYHNHHAALRNFACRELNINIVATQHSAWGGYLANGPLITEVLINGCDDYLTFGWREKPLDGSGWRKNAFQLSSPVISELKKKSFPMNRNADLKRRVLLCPGFLFRYPSIYNSSLRIDNLLVWQEAIADIVRKLSADNIHVDIIMYSNVMAENMKNSLNYWLQFGGGFIKAYPDHDMSVRVFLGTPEFEKNYDAVIWDLPAGGFSEAIACGRRSFSMWNDKILKSLPEGDEAIGQLLNSGILFRNGEELRKTLRSLYQDKNWFENKQNTESINKFMESFMLLNADWDREWSTFFKKRLKNE